MTVKTSRSHGIHNEFDDTVQSDRIEPIFSDDHAAPNHQSFIYPSIENSRSFWNVRQFIADNTAPRNIKQ